MNPQESTETRMRTFVERGNLYALLELSLDCPRREVGKQLVRYRGQLAKHVGTQSELVSTCIRMLNVCESMLNDRELRPLYLCLVGATLADSRFRIVIPHHEVSVVHYLCDLISALGTDPVAWGRGFPIRTATGFAWVDGVNFCTSHQKDKLAALKTIVGNISQGLLREVRDADLVAVADRLAMSGAWPACEQAGRYASYENGILDMVELRFETWKELKLTMAPTFDPSAAPVASVRIAGHALSAEDLRILDLARSTVVANASHQTGLELWDRSWRSLPGLAQLVQRAPMFDSIVTRQPMMRDSEVQACLYRNLSRSIGHEEDRPGSRAVFMLGASGCAKSSIVDIVCAVACPESHVHVLHDMSGAFAEESTIGKRVVVYSDISDANRLSFEQLSNATDRNARPVNRKHAAYEVCTPPSLVIGTSNSSRVIRMPRNGILNERAIAARVLPFIFSEPVPDAEVRENARVEISQQEGPYVLLLLLCHSMAARLSAGEGARVPPLLRAAAAWLASEVTAASSSTECRSRVRKRVRLATESAGTSYWNRVLRELEEKKGMIV